MPLLLITCIIIQSILPQTPPSPAGLCSTLILFNQISVNQKSWNNLHSQNVNDQSHKNRLSYKIIRTSQTHHQINTSYQLRPAVAELGPAQPQLVLVFCLTWEAANARATATKPNLVTSSVVWLGQLKPQITILGRHVSAYDMGLGCALPDQVACMCYVRLHALLSYVACNTIVTARAGFRGGHSGHVPRAPTN